MSSSDQKDGVCDCKVVASYQWSHSLYVCIHVKRDCTCECIYMCVCVRKKEMMMILHYTNVRDSVTDAKRSQHLKLFLD